MFVDDIVLIVERVTQVELACSTGVVYLTARFERLKNNTPECSYGLKEVQSPIRLQGVEDRGLLVPRIHISSNGESKR